MISLSWTDFISFVDSEWMPPETPPILRRYSYLSLSVTSTDDANANALSIPIDDRSRRLRGLVVEALAVAQRGHIGASMSLIEILRALYDGGARVRPDEPDWPERDRIILSKGHGCLALYALLADRGFFPVDELQTFCAHNSRLGGHPERGNVPGVEASTGALGHGLSIGVGQALGLRLRGSNARVFVIAGDGELNEGAVWEAAMSAAKHGLDNLCILVDYNKVQSYGPTSDVLELEPLAEKWRAFGFAVIEANGHDVAVLDAILRRIPIEMGMPTCVVCHTIKGKGLPFAEGDPSWHHKSRLSDADIAALTEATAIRA
jgi:transketolase